jgi:cell division septation protein DedD
MDFRSIGYLMIATALLTGCAGGFNLFSRDAAADTSVAMQKSVRLIDRDVEAPSVFQANDDALWDGRPSLGGVWVASPDAVDPERVIMRNPANGKFVIGALFKRERDNPGPSLQISSDAAAALGLLAGQPAKINVTALRREEEKANIDANQPILDTAETVKTEGTIDNATPVAVETLAAAPAAQSIKAAATTPAVPTAPVIAAPVIAAPVIAAPVISDGQNGRLIQVGLFSIEQNANRAVAQLKAAGIPASIRASTSKGKPLWSVTARGNASGLAKVKSAGFKDAYFLKG